MKKILSSFVILLLTTTVFISGCTAIPSTQTITSTSSYSPSDSDLPVGMGRLTINITDPPVPLENVEVSFENLEIHKAGGPWTTIPMDNDTFELLDLDGVTELLASYMVEAGVYTQIRLDIATVQIWVTGDETPHEARIPSNKIKLVGSFKVVEGEDTEITVDINGAQSVQTGNGEYIFRPVVKLLIPESAKPSDEDAEDNGETETVPAELN
jgi:hypothetical protein